MKGIYSIEIGGKFYIGKDTQISTQKRRKEHISMLKKNSHYNKPLQDAFNSNNGIYKYHIILQDDNISNEELEDLEVLFIKEIGSYDNGYNLTLGGVGGSGIIISDEEKERRSRKIIGELNPQSKITNEQFFEVVALFKQGKTNSEIANIYNLHDRYVSLIRHKKRFKKLWEQVEEYEEVKSDGQKRGLDYEQFKSVVQMLEDGFTNAAIEKKYKLGSGTGSRIRNKKLYKRYWNQYESGL